MKRKIIIITRALEMGGVEVGLVNFINLIDKNRYDVTLVELYNYGILKERYPKDIEYLTVFNRIEYLRLVGYEFAQDFWGKCKYKCMYHGAKILYKNTNYPRFHCGLTLSKDIKGEYDVAIDYHGYASFTTFYMIKKIKASRYITFVHAENVETIKPIEWMSDGIDDIFCVSKACKYNMEQIYPALKKKLKIFYNVMDERDIKERALLLQHDIPEHQKNVLLTIGRLCTQKGYDFLLEAANELNKMRIDFHWYIIGEGTERSKLLEQIQHYQLESRVILLGEKINPYPYIKRCDIYVQTSHYEGFCLAICEAKILNKPIVSTDLPCIREQIDNDINGLLCEKNGMKIAEAVYRLIEDDRLKKKFNAELKGYTIKNEEQIQILNSL